MERRIGLTIILLFILAWIFLASTTPVRAQEPDPTPTPTPSYLTGYTLSSGNTLIVEKRITYGEAAIVMMLGIVLVVLVLFMLVRVTKLWIR